MNFQVPQFIEVEDKIFGPLTFRQFVYLAGGGALAFILYAYLPIYIAMLPILAIIGLALGLSFYKYNNRPLVLFLESAMRYQLGPKLYIWKRDEKKPVAKTVAKSQTGIMVPKLSSSKLKDLSWSLDVKEKVQ